MGNFEFQLKMYSYLIMLLQRVFGTWYKKSLDAVTVLSIDRV